jgi:hypothetical protein
MDKQTPIHLRRRDEETDPKRLMFVRIGLEKEEVLEQTAQDSFGWGRLAGMRLKLAREARWDTIGQVAKSAN